MPRAVCKCLQGWDKTYCLQFVEKDFDEIHFFGDKTYEVRLHASKCDPIRSAGPHTAHADRCTFCRAAMTTRSSRRRRPSATRSLAQQTPSCSAQSYLSRLSEVSLARVRIASQLAQIVICVQCAAHGRFCCKALLWAHTPQDCALAVDAAIYRIACVWDYALMQRCAYLCQAWACRGTRSVAVRSNQLEARSFSSRQLVSRSLVGTLRRPHNANTARQTASFVSAC